MKKFRKEQNKIIALCAVLCLAATGCSSTGLAQESSFESSFENTQEEPVDIYVSSASGVVKRVDKEAQTITICELNQWEDKTLSYDGATVFTDKYGGPLTVDQLIPGSIVTLAYNSNMEKMGSLQINSDSWNYADIQKFSMNTENRTITVGQEEYHLSDQLLVFSGQEEILPEQILSQDVISMQGIGQEVLSIRVDRGHGYLELKNEEYFVGGWIEIGQTVISQLSPEMLFSVPEGSYQVRLTTDLLDESREVEIRRDEITTLDLGDIEKPVPESGQVTFDITPESASVYIDNNLINQFYTLKLPVGMHQLTVSASGYDTVSQYFEVTGEEPLKLQVNLTQSKSSVSDNDISWASDKKEGATITIQTPDGAEVYEDNLYKGYAPVTYTKNVGTHVLTFRKSGYVTKSYSIEVADDDENVVYSFPDLEPESSSTVSGNSVSDNTVKTQSTVSGNSVSGNSVSGNSVSVE